VLARGHSGGGADSGEDAAETPYEGAGGFVVGDRGHGTVRHGQRPHGSVGAERQERGDGFGQGGGPGGGAARGGGGPGLRLAGSGVAEGEEVVRAGHVFAFAVRSDRSSRGRT